MPVGHAAKVMQPFTVGIPDPVIWQQLDAVGQGGPLVQSLLVAQLAAVGHVEPVMQLAPVG